MTSWIYDDAKQVPQEEMLAVHYLRFCPACEDFKPQETIIDGQDRILRCTVCNTSERFVYTNGVLVPEGMLPMLITYIKGRVKGVFKHG